MFSWLFIGVKYSVGWEDQISSNPFNVFTTRFNYYVFNSIEPMCLLLLLQKMCPSNTRTSGNGKISRGPYKNLTSSSFPKRKKKKVSSWNKQVVLLRWRNVRRSTVGYMLRTYFVINCTPAAWNFNEDVFISSRAIWKTCREGLSPSWSASERAESRYRRESRNRPRSDFIARAYCAAAAVGHRQRWK